MVDKRAAILATLLVIGVIFIVSLMCLYPGWSLITLLGLIIIVAICGIWYESYKHFKKPISAPQAGPTQQNRAYQKNNRPADS